MTTNWHVPLNKFSDEQRKVIERVYGGQPHHGYLYNDCSGTMTVRHPEGKEISSEEAFRILGLNRLLEPEVFDDWFEKYQEACSRASCAESAIKDLEVANETLKKTYNELFEQYQRLEDQLSKQPEQGLQVDWRLTCEENDHLVQDKETGSVKFLTNQYFSECSEHYTILATRPKPKIKPLSTLTKGEKAVLERFIVDNHAKTLSMSLLREWLNTRQEVKI